MAVGRIMSGTEQQPHPLVANIPGFKRPRIYDRRAVDTDAQVIIFALHIARAYEFPLNLALLLAA